jgi:hypothetical protein
VRLKMAKSCVITAILTAFLLLVQRGFTWWQAAIFVYCTLLNNLMTDFWVLSSDAFVITANEIERALTEVRVEGSGRGLFKHYISTSEWKKGGEILSSDSVYSCNAFRIQTKYSLYYSEND